MGFSGAEVLLTLDTIARQGVILTPPNVWICTGDPDSSQCLMALGKTGIQGLCARHCHPLLFFSLESLI